MKYSQKWDKRRNNKSNKNSKKNMTKISKSLSYALRHGVIALGLNMDSEGYVRLNDLLNHPDLPTLSNVSVDTIKQIVETNDKKRFSLINKKRNIYIRANQGHSKTIGNKINDDLLCTELDSPYEMCIHGTVRSALHEIMKEGLSPMNRKHIHMAKGLTKDDGVISGMRNTSTVYIYINMKAAMDDGIKFYESDNGVILCAERIHPQYFKNIVLCDG